MRRLNRRRLLYVGGVALCGLALGVTGCRQPTAADTTAPPVPAMTEPGTATPASQQASATPTDAPTTNTPECTETPARVEVACPFGYVNDPYPGRCGRYRDTNGNGYCDWSEPA